MRLLYYSPASYGGIADYAHEQANALAYLGVDVTFLCTPSYRSGRGEKYKVVPILRDIVPKRPILNKTLKSVHFTFITLENFKQLANFIDKEGFKYVLFGSYVEYLSPLWSGRLRKLAESGVRFGAVLHDPVRYFIVGPRWWHRWSIACGYAFLCHIFVHESVELDTVRPMPQLKTSVIPHGVYAFPQTTLSREAARGYLNIPCDATVMLAFGRIWNHKNLDLVIQAMVSFPDLYLLVVGKEQSSGQKPVSVYQELAIKLGVADRCRWHIRFIPDTEVGIFFVAADVILLTYSKTFRSASGVLNIAVHYRKPCLASGGEGALHSVVHRYSLGVWIEPDDLDALVNGIRIWLHSPLTPRWKIYCQDNSWVLNAKLVISHLLEK